MAIENSLSTRVLDVLLIRLQTICIKWQMYLGTALNKLTNQEHLGEILSSVKKPASGIYNSDNETFVMISPWWQTL